MDTQSASAYVLVVEDDIDSREIMSRTLEYFGFRVKEASNGIEGLDKAKEEKPALIILDVMMPQMNGFQFLSLLNSEPHLKDVPVIVLSAAASPQMADLPGVKHVIRKASMSLTEMHKIIADTLNTEGSEEHTA